DQAVWVGHRAPDLDRPRLASRHGSKNAHDGPNNGISGGARIAKNERQTGRRRNADVGELDRVGEDIRTRDNAWTPGACLRDHGKDVGPRAKLDQETAVLDSLRAPRAGDDPIRVVRSFGHRQDIGLRERALVGEDDPSTHDRAWRWLERE